MSIKPPVIDANTAAMAKSAKDIRVPLGTCPLLSLNVQLLPLRYGLVENLDPRSELPMPFNTSSQPLGIRLLRDGYLYVVDGSAGYLHEYRIEGGEISKHLWIGQEIPSDTRLHPVGEPHLVFARNHILYASYAEIQWTAFKCAQVLKSKNERSHFMQRIDVVKACPEKGGAHLLTQAQTEKWLAEVAEVYSPPKTLPEGAHPEEGQAYQWEDQPLFAPAAIETLISQVQGPYKNDFLFLVLRDDIGVMRDLASAQLKVADWIEQWSADDSCQAKYLTGSYIQSLYEVNAARLAALARTDPAVKALMDETGEEQRLRILGYLKARRDYPDPGIYGDEAHWRRAAETRPYAKALVDMRDALGPQLYEKHCDAINSLSLQSWEALHGKEIGQRGIDDLIHREEMEAFVARQQTLLSHWRARLDRIRQDRLTLFTEGRFHRAAWYYDFNLSAQIKHRLETEFVCVAAMCPDQEALEKLAAYLEANPLMVVPGLDTLNLAAQIDVAKKLADLSDFSIKVSSLPENLANVNTLVHQFNSLMKERLPNYGRLNEQFRGLQSLLDGTYNPARQLRMADQLDMAHEAFKRTQHIDPNSYIRSIGSAARLQLPREFSRQGLTLRAASGAEIAAFQVAQTRAINLRVEMKEVYRLRKDELRRQALGLSHSGSEVVHVERIGELKNALWTLEERITNALVVGGQGPAQIGTVIEALDPQLRAEMNRTVRDFRATGAFNKPIAAAIGSKGDGIALALFVIQGLKFIEAWVAYQNDTVYSNKAKWIVFETFVGMSAAGFAMVQGLSVTIFQAHVKEMASATGKLNTVSRLGRWTGISGFGAFVGGGIAASLELSKHSLQWGKAIAEGNSKALSASSMQITGDAVLLGTNTWAVKHTSSIIKHVMTTPKELRPLAWAEASPKLLAIGARANLIGLIGTALQLVGEGLYNYFNLDELYSWMHTSVWGIESAGHSVRDEWALLAKAVQKPTCRFVRDGKRTYLRLVLPGVSTREMDSRQLRLLVLQRSLNGPIFGRQHRSAPYYQWQDRTARWVTQLIVVSEEKEALTLQWPISENDHTSDFALAFTIGYQLELGRDYIHYTSFDLRDLRILWAPTRPIYLQGSYTLTEVENLPAHTGDVMFKIFDRDDLATADD